ncbi:hypothetical protein G6F56_006490 [Rhizopus delemar]|nr:hypothetical protein G6F56_006490 [Rhizopus delemar]
MQKPSTRPMRKKQLTPKQKLVKDSAVQRERMERFVFVWQEKLFSRPRVSVQALERATLYLQPKTFSEIVEERNVQEWCGYPLCQRQPPQEFVKYKITANKVFDQTELASYCSDQCFKKAKYYVMQLSEEPVWFRDLNQTPKAHIIPLDQDFETAIQEQRKTSFTSTQEIKQQYVKHLLKNVPTNDDGTLPIVEKNAVEPQTAPEVTSFDTLEGYRIEIKKDGKLPTSMVLNKNPEKKEEKKDKKVDPTDEDELFNTMMMLKDMNMDKPPSEQIQNVSSDTKEKAPKKEIKEAPLKETSIKKSEKETSTSATTTASSSATAPAKQEKPKKKKKRVPELSLFGTIWTMLDHMTTKSTRIYLNELENQGRVDVMTLLQQENRTLDEANSLRGHILSERILETYHIIRVQVGISESMEDDIVNVIKTFKLSDASMVAPGPAQCYMLTLVIVKSLADITLKDSAWKEPFESCCKAIEQSSDMIDACVRVLKVASV